MERLYNERAAFLNLCQSVKLPKSVDRLGLMPIDTFAKEQIAESNQSQPEQFASARLAVDGDEFVSNAEIFAAYGKWCEDTATVRTVADSAALASDLSEWYSLHGVASARTNAERGRRGITLAI